MTASNFNFQFTTVLFQLYYSFSLALLPLLQFYLLPFNTRQKCYLHTFLNTRSVILIHFSLITRNVTLLYFFLSTRNVILNILPNNNNNNNNNFTSLRTASFAPLAVKKNIGLESTYKFVLLYCLLYY